MPFSLRTIFIATTLVAVVLGLNRVAPVTPKCVAFFMGGRMGGINFNTEAELLAALSTTFWKSRSCGARSSRINSDDWKLHLIVS